LRQWFEQQSVFTAQLLAGPVQKVGVEQLPLLHTPEQHTPPLLALQLLPEVRQRLPGPPSLLTLPASSLPECVTFPEEGLQLQPTKVHPAASAAKKTSIGLFMRRTTCVQMDSASV
jgi:hypothetical protein